MLIPFQPHEPQRQGSDSAGTKTHQPPCGHVGSNRCSRRRKEHPDLARPGSYLCSVCRGLSGNAALPTPSPHGLPPVFPSTSLQVLRLGLCVKDKRADPEGGRGAGPCQQRQGAVSPHRTHPPRATFSSLPSRPSAGPSPDPWRTGDLSSSLFPENWASCCS